MVADIGARAQCVGPLVYEALELGQLAVWQIDGRTEGPWKMSEKISTV